MESTGYPSVNYSKMLARVLFTNANSKFWFFFTPLQFTVTAVLTLLEVSAAFFMKQYNSAAICSIYRVSQGNCFGVFHLPMQVTVTVAIYICLCLILVCVFTISGFSILPSFFSYLLYPMTC